MVDMHFHSIFSDGSESPERLAEMGAKLGLKGMVLTDHDTFAGTARFAAAAAERGIRTISGVELSLDFGKHELHLLGYGFDPANPRMVDTLAEFQRSRKERTRKILDRLDALGVPVTMEEVEQARRAMACGGDAPAAEGDNGEASIGRPHIAAALVARGYVPDVRAAFTRYLAHDAPAYVPRERLKPAEAVALVHQAGGTPVIAHPKLIGLDWRQLRKFVGELRDAGLAGLEAYHSGHDPVTTARILAIARDLGLCCTGGSDFHGIHKPAIGIGAGYGGLRVPDECFDALYERHRR